MYSNLTQITYLVLGGIRIQVPFPQVWDFL